MKNLGDRRNGMGAIIVRLMLKAPSRGEIVCDAETLGENLIEL